MKDSNAFQLTVESISCVLFHLILTTTLCCEMYYHPHFFWRRKLRSGWLRNTLSKVIHILVGDEAGIWTQASHFWACSQTHLIGSCPFCRYDLRVSCNLQWVLSIYCCPTKCHLSLVSTPSIASMVSILPTLWIVLTLSIGKAEIEWGSFRKKQQKWFRKERDWHMREDKKRHIYLTGLGYS